MKKILLLIPALLLCAGAFAQSLENITATNEFQAVQKQVSSNPQLMEDIRQLLQDPEIMALLADPSFMALAGSGNAAALQEDPRIQKLIQNPKIQAIIGQIQQ